MILLNLSHVILTFATKQRFSKPILQTQTHIQQVPKIIPQLSLRRILEPLTLALLNLFIGLRLYIGGPLNKIPNYFLTKTTKQ